MTEQDRATGQAEELVWLGVPVDWAKLTLMSLCLDVAAPTQRHHVLVDLVEPCAHDAVTFHCKLLQVFCATIDHDV